MTRLELTILMPCLNESETICVCIEKAKSFLDTHDISGEILIADNGSTDGSQAIAVSCGARVISIPERGYGAALIGGSYAALGKYVIMGDADDSYDFTALMPFVEKLREGYDLVMGNRFKGSIKKGAMPPLHRYLGNPVLSFLGRLFYPSGIGDFHCGLRGYRTEAIRGLGLRTLGMEYASEMIVQATLNGLKITEVPTVLHPDGRSRPPHLRSWRDGWRHLKFLLMHAPNWLFFAPGFIFTLTGLMTTIILAVASPVVIGNMAFDVNTMIFMIVLFIAGINILCFGALAKVYAIQSGFIPAPKRKKFFNGLNANSGSFVGGVLLMLGITGAAGAFLYWRQQGYGELAPDVMRITLPSLALMVTGIQIALASFLADILRIKTRREI